MKLVTVKFTKPWGNYAVGNVASFSPEEVEPMIKGYSYSKNGRKYKVAPVANKVGTVDTVKANAARRELVTAENIAKLEAKRDALQAKIDKLKGVKPQEPTEPDAGDEGDEGDQDDGFKMNSKTTKDEIVAEMKARGMEVDEEKLKDDLAAELQAELDKE